MYTNGRNDWPSIPGYLIEKKLGEGTFGHVYQAVQNSLARPVALKVGKLVPSGDESLIRETERLSRLRHPNIVSIFDAGVAEQARGFAPYLAMELLEAGSLKDCFPTLRTRQSLRYNLSSFSDLLRAVRHAHTLGITHADLHEENLLLTKLEDRHYVKIADFGFPSGFNAKEIAERVTRDEEQLRILFWSYFYFPRIDPYFEPAEFNRLGLGRMIDFIEEMLRFRLSDSMLEDDEDYVGVSEIEDREKRISRVALSYALDHPMMRNIGIEVRPYLGADVSVERGENLDTFLFWPGVSTKSSAYLFLLLSMADIYWNDYQLAPSHQLRISTDSALPDLCRTFLWHYRFLAYFSDFDERGYLLSHILDAMHETLERCAGAQTLTNAVTQAAIFNGILLRLGREELGLAQDLEPSVRETVKGLGYLVSRLPWKQLLDIEVVRRLLQVTIDRSVKDPHATALLPGNTLEVRPVNRFDNDTMQVEIAPVDSQDPTVQFTDDSAILEINLSYTTLAKLSGLIAAERALRLPTSQFFECSEVSILARYGIGLYYRIGSSWFTFTGPKQEELYSRFDSAVEHAAQLLPPKLVDLSRSSAETSLRAQKEFLDRHTVICPNSFEDRRYRDDLHRIVASYGMVVHLEKNKLEALRKLDEEWFARAESTLSSFRGN